MDVTAAATHPHPSRPTATLRRGVSAIVPVYNSEGTLEALVERLDKTLTDVAGAGNFEVIMVNDGSRDASWPVIERLAAAHGFVRGITLMRNFGQHNALMCGVRAARFETAVTLDDDLQNPPEEIPTLLERLTDEMDVVYGAPQREQHGLLRDLASQITKLVLQRAMGAETARNISAFRAFRTRLREAFMHYSGPHVSIDVLLTWATTRFTAIRVRHEPRVIGTSNYTLMKLITHAMNMLTGFSTAPLRIASLLGFVCTGFGLLVLATVLVRYFVNGSVVPGFPFLASVVSIFAGAQLFTLGIIGEYLARLHMRAMDRPTFVELARTEAPAVANEPAPAPFAPDPTDHSPPSG